MRLQPSLIRSIARDHGWGWVARRAWTQAVTLRPRRGPWQREWPASPLAGRLLPGIDPEALGDRWLREAPRALGVPAPEGLARWRQALAETAGPEVVRETIAAAERVLAGALPFYSSRWVELGWPPDWHPGPWAGAARLHWSALPAEARGLDIKDAWEPGRFAAAYLLVRAFHMSGDPKFAEGFWRLVESWRMACPPDTGVHWRCGQETSLRAMAWIFALHALRDTPETTPARVAMMAGMLDEQARRIAATTHYARLQDNNHSMSEGMGLWCIGLTFPQLRNAARHVAHGRRLLEGEALRLIAPDGSFSQMSSNYHRLMLQDYVFAARLGEAAGQHFAPAAMDRLRAAASFLRDTTDLRSGWAPNTGGNDGALVLPLNGCDYNDMRPVAAAAHALFARERLYQPGPWHEDLLWLDGLDAAAWPVNNPARQPASTAREGGWLGLRGRESWALLRCGRYRTRPRHADSLHLDLWWRGLNIAQDAGSFRYTAPPPWNDGLKHTAVHNTVAVDGVDQLEAGPRFLWLRWHDVRILGHHAGESSGTMAAEHDGYRRLPDPVTHRRTVSVDGDQWTIVDELSGAAVHDIALHWLLLDAPYEVAGDTVHLQSPEGPVTLRITAEGAEPAVGVVRAAPETTEGWVSRYYGDRQPALSVTARLRAQLPLRLVSTFSLGIADR